MNRRTLSICLVLFLLLALSFVSLFGSSKMASAQVAPTPTPTATVAGVDLVISSVTWSPYAPLAKQSVTFSATIKNAGSVASPAGVIHDVRFTITSGVHPTTYIMSTSYTQSLAPGASATVQADAAWSVPTGADDYWISAAVDYGARIAESNENNNTAGGGTIIVEATPAPPQNTLTPTRTFTPAANLPDLTVLSITEFGYTLPTSTPNAQGCWPSGPYGRIGLRVTIQNIGTANAGAFVLDLNGVQQVVGSLAANQTLAVDFTGMALTRTRTATVDITNLIAESNETNNVYTLALSAATSTSTGTAPPQICLTRTPTPTNGPSSTVTRTPTFTLTVIKTPTYTPTQVDRTATLWASSTPSRTPTPATNTPTRTPTSTPTCGCGMFAVQLLSNGPDSNQQTAFNVKLINYGPAQANISFRIYFTLDGAQVASNYVLAKNYDQSGVAVISGPTLASGSNYYFTVSYGATALAAGGSWEFQTALHLADWSSNYNSANDWWHTTGALPTTYTTWSTIPLYVNGSYAGGGNPQP